MVICSLCPYVHIAHYFSCSGEYYDNLQYIMKNNTLLFINHRQIFYFFYNNQDDWSLL
jgi:hypothetical protein